MKKYKYKIIKCPFHIINYDLIAGWLEKMQNEGWEFVSVGVTEVHNGYSLADTGYIFRKEIIEPPTTPSWDKN